MKNRILIHKSFLVDVCNKELFKDVYNTGLLLFLFLFSGIDPYSISWYRCVTFTELSQ